MDIFNTIDSSYINFHYWNRYKIFIENIIAKGYRKLEYKERHHIIPRSINSDLKNNGNNIIILTAKEHFIAHLILSKCFIKNTELYYKMNYALYAMVKLKMKYHRRSYYLSSRYYEKTRLEFCKYRKSYMQEQVKTGKYDKFIGRNKPSSIRGKIGITNGKINRYIDPNDPIPSGWRKGHTQQRDEINHKIKLKEAWARNKQNRIGKNHPMYKKGYKVSGSKNGMYGKHRRWINNNSTNKIVFLEDLDDYLKNGWILGKIKLNK